MRQDTSLGGMLGESSPGIRDMLPTARTIPSPNPLQLNATRVASAAPERKRLQAFLAVYPGTAPATHGPWEFPSSPTSRPALNCSRPLANPCHRKNNPRLPFANKGRAT